MYAVFLHGGKQHIVKKGDYINLESINAKIGEIVFFKKILLFSNNQHITLGYPFTDIIYISAKIILHDRHKKIKIIKFNRRKHYKKHQGHRQYFSKVKIINFHITPHDISS